MTSANSIVQVFGWTLRFVMWGFCCVVVLVILLIYSKFTLAGHLKDCMDLTGRPGPGMSSLEWAQSYVACVDRRSGPEKVLFSGVSRAVASLRNAPCRYIGIWHATRKDGTSYKVDLQEDGSFRAEPYNDPRHKTGAITGSWGVDHKRMVWLYDQGMIWPPDVNLMIDESSQGFTLIEHDGVKTRYAPFEDEQVGVCEENGR